MLITLSNKIERDVRAKTASIVVDIERVSCGSRCSVVHGAIGMRMNHVMHRFSLRIYHEQRE